MDVLMKRAWLLLLIVAAPEAQAGFRHPIEQNGETDGQIQSTPVAPSSKIYGPALPAAPNVQVQGVRLPRRKRVLLPKDPLPVYDLKGLNKEQVLAFSRKARSMPLPSHEFIPEARGGAIAAQYQDALRIVPHSPIRTPVRITVVKIGKIVQPPSAIAYENMVKRIDALFLALELKFPAAVYSLWELAHSKENHKDLLPRDALFAGLISRQAGWEAAASYLYGLAVEKRVDTQERYLAILWNELDAFTNVPFVADSIRGVDPEQVRSAGVKGDKANYALARMIMEGRWEKIRDGGFAQERINAPLLRQRLVLSRALAQLRDPKMGKMAVFDRLRELEVTAEESVQQEARLALARALMQQGATQEALAYYEKVTKDGKNRLEVMAEQAYAEYRAGRHQESLGKALGLQSPYFQYGFAPDIHLIEVLNRKMLCDFGGADQGLLRFSERYGRELAALDELLTRKPKPEEFYAELISFHGREAPYRYQRYLLHLTSVMENQKLLNAAEGEIALLGKVGTRKYEPTKPNGWENFVSSLRTSWDKRARTYKNESVLAALGEAAYMAKRLRHSFGHAELLGLDVSTAASKDFNLQSALNFPARKPASDALVEDKFHWPFEQEIWEDELDFLKMKNPSKCAAVAKTP